MEEEKDVSGLINIILHTKNEKMLSLAKSALIKIGDCSKDHLVTEFYNLIMKNPDKSVAILSILKEISFKQELLSLLSDKREKIDLMHLVENRLFERAELGDARVIPVLLAIYIVGPNVGDSKKAVKSLGKIKSPNSVEALKLILLVKEGLGHDEAIESLGQIKDFGAIDVLRQLLFVEGKCRKAAEVLAKIGWKPRTVEEKFYFLYALERLSEIRDLGQAAVKYLSKIVLEKSRERYSKPYKEVQLLGSIGGREAAETLIKVLEEFNEKVGFKKDDFPREVAKAVAQTGDKRGAEAVIIYLMNNPFYSKNYEEYFDWFSGYFEDFTSLILKISSHHWILGEYHEGMVLAELIGVPSGWEGCKIDLKPNLEALEELCSINNSVANNILHIVAKKPDYPAVVATSEYGVIEGTVILKPLRDRAKEELQRRGNPVYDKSAYLDETSWRFK